MREIQLVSLIGCVIALIIAIVAIHSGGTLFLIRGAQKYSGGSEYLRLTAGAAIRILGLLLIHMTDVILWAVLYAQQGFFADFRGSLDFSLYATVGYGDVVLKEEYKMIGGVETLVSLLMFSWSTALLVGFLQRVYSPLLRSPSHFRQDV